MTPSAPKRSTDGCPCPGCRPSRRVDPVSLFGWSLSLAFAVLVWAAVAAWAVQS